ncbi:MAG: hypothetical protein RL275_1162 [Chloroflexota bacterium]
MKEFLDPVSIEMNKQGKKSEAQIKFIKEATSPRIWLGGGLSLLVIGGCFYAFLFSIDAGDGGGIFGLILGVVGLAAFLRGAFIWNMNRKLLNEPVQSAEGTVVYKMQNDLAQYFDMDRFIADTKDGRQLYPAGMAGIPPQLAPGKYRFYYLEHRNWLLSAEPLSSAEEMRNALNEILAKAFGYDLAHLEHCRKAAREGQMLTTEGLPTIEAVSGLVGTSSNSATALFFCTLGEVKFLIPRRGSYAFIHHMTYRAYYRETPSDTLFGGLMNLMKNKTVEAVEVI